MTALSADRTVPEYVHIDPTSGGYICHYPVITDDIIYKGSLLNVSGGYAQPMTGTTAFLGIALEHKDNSGGASGALTVKTLVGAAFHHTITATTSSIGAAVYGVDDQTLNFTATNQCPVGHFVQLSGTNTAIIKSLIPGAPIS